MGSATRYAEVNAPVAEVYAYWKNFENFPAMFSDVEKVVVDGTTSHWVVSGPAGKSVEWDAEVTEDVPNERIAWRSVGENTVDTSGVVRFDEGVGDATKVTVALSYDPPAGKLGEIVAEVLKDPDGQLERALQEFSRIVESGGLRTA
ncbi:MAG: SRPBCC family protein [Actinomycetota bacterium]|nr:SRPBCC family protein [Actinomycetota bacterium]